MIVIGSDNHKIAFFTTDFNLNLIYLIFLNLFLSIVRIRTRCGHLKKAKDETVSWLDADFI